MPDLERWIEYKGKVFCRNAAKRRIVEIKEAVSGKKGTGNQ